MEHTRVLITGASGLLGKYLLGCVPEGVEAFGTHYCNFNGKQDYHLDVLSTDEINYVFMYARPNIVIHLAAIGSVDFCERNPFFADRVNIGGTAHIVDACQRYGAKIVLLSTNAVFDGTHPPYKEEDHRNPLSVYGHSKVKAEDIVAECDDFLVVRTARMFGRNWRAGRDNWLDIVPNRLSAGKVLEVVTDDIGRPTYAGNLAETVWDLLEVGAKGFYHVAGDDSISMYQFARLIAETYNVYHEHPLDVDLIKPVTTKEKFPTIATRPANTTFDLTKYYNTNVRKVGTTQQGLDRMAIRGEL